MTELERYSEFKQAWVRHHPGLADVQGQRWESPEKSKTVGGKDEVQVRMETLLKP